MPRTFWCRARARRFAARIKGSLRTESSGPHSSYTDSRKGVQHFQGGKRILAAHDDPVVEQRMQEYAEKYNNSWRGQFFNERDVSKMETDQYARDRGGLHLYEQLLRVARIKYGYNSPMVTGRQK